MSRLSVRGRSVLVSLVLLAALATGCGESHARSQAGGLSRSALAAAAATVRLQLEGVDPTRDGRGPVRAYLLSVAAMEYVQSHVSPAAYAALIKKGPQRLSTTEQVLRAGAGICAGQVEAFVGLVRRLGIRARSIEFYYASKGLRVNHIVAETRWAGTWHLFDVTFGTFFRRPAAARTNVLSLSDVLRLRRPTALAVTNATDLWLTAYESSGLDPFDYLDSARHRRLVIDGVGVIEPVEASRGVDTAFRFAAMPDLAGQPEKLTGGLGDLRIRFPLPDVTRKLRLDVAGKACVAQHALLTATGTGWTSSVALIRVPSSGPVALPVHGIGPVIVSVEQPGPARNCYVVFRGAVAEGAGPGQQPSSNP